MCHGCGGEGDLLLRERLLNLHSYNIGEELAHSLFSWEGMFADTLSPSFGWKYDEVTLL